MWQLEREASTRDPFMNLRYFQAHKPHQYGFNDIPFLSSYLIMPFLSEFFEPSFLTNCSCEVLYDFPEVTKSGSQCAQGDVDVLFLPIYEICKTLQVMLLLAIQTFGPLNGVL